MCEALAFLWGTPFTDSKEESPPALRRSAVTLIQLDPDTDDDPDTAKGLDDTSSPESSDSETTENSQREGLVATTSSDSEAESPPGQPPDHDHHIPTVATLTGIGGRFNSPTPTVSCIKKKRPPLRVD